MRTAVATSTLVLLLCAFSAAAPAPDASGKWHAQVPWPGTLLTDFYFNFRIDGQKLTGTVTYAIGDGLNRMEIVDGTIGGSDLSFAMITKMRDADARWTFKGRFQGGEIAFTAEAPPFAPPRPAAAPGGPAPAAGAPAAPAPAAAPPASPAKPSLMEFVARRQ